jgi:predicted PurR-regulated permease PerM
VAALLLTALLQPLTARLKRAGMPPILATWCALLAAIAVIAGLGTLIGVQVSAEYPTLVKDVTHSGHQLQAWLAGPPFHIRQMRLQQLATTAINELKAHQSAVAGTVLTGGKYVVEIVAGSVLTLFVGFFLIKDGERIWGWLTGFLSPGRADRADRAGRAAWHVLVPYVRGTMLIAAIHSVVIGLTLWILGVPLVIPLAAVVFLAAFVPLIGILVAGTLAIGVTLGTTGWIAAVTCSSRRLSGASSGCTRWRSSWCSPSAAFSAASRAPWWPCRPPPRSPVPGPSCAGGRTRPRWPGGPGAPPAERTTSAMRTSRCKVCG